MLNDVIQSRLTSSYISKLEEEEEGESGETFLELPCNRMTTISILKNYMLPKTLQKKLKDNYFSTPSPKYGRPQQSKTSVAW